MENNYSWFVAVVTHNTEIKCVERLEKLVNTWRSSKAIDSSEEVATYVPTQTVVRIQPSTGRRVRVKKVLAPCYLFIRCKDAVRYQIACEAPYILRFLMDRASKTESGRNDFARIPNGQMENFKRMVEEAVNAVIIDPSRVHVGDKVRITTGRLAGLVGNICKEPDGSSMIALRVDFLGYAKMECPIANLELVKQ